jgi:surfeit locus 1 family protein
VSVRRKGEGLWGPTVLVVAGVAMLIGLGTWQRERLVWKEALIATLQARLAAEPAPLPAAQTWATLTAAAEFRRVTATVTFLHDREALVYTSGSSLRRDISGPGYWVFTPARLADGAIVMVDRGFVPESRRDAAARRDGQVAGPVTVTGVLRWPETPGLFTPAADPAAGLWFARDSTAIAAAKGIAAVAPFYIDQESPVPAGGWPMPGRMSPMLANNHFGYMLTWYGLAAALAAVYGAWLLAWRRRGGPAGAMAP